MRVRVDVENTKHQVVIALDRFAVEPLFEELSAATAPLIVQLCVSLIYALHALRSSLHTRWCEKKVHMVCHQAEGVQPTTVLIQSQGEQAKVGVVVPRI